MTHEITNIMRKVFFFFLFDFLWVEIFVRCIACFFTISMKYEDTRGFAVIYVLH